MFVEAPHRRLNPLTGDWVLVSPQRQNRPWQGQFERISTARLPAYDPDCYLCPRNRRAGGKTNPDYASTFVFDNDFPALIHHPQAGDQTPPETVSLFDAHITNGICRVVCFSPRHDLTLPEMSLDEIRAVLQTWASQTVELNQLEGIEYVQVFENKGELMGCSNPHPHSQIWSTSFLPNEPAREQIRLLEFVRHQGGCLLCEVLAEEMERHERVVCSNSFFTALVPFWAVWPFEVLLISQRHAGSLFDLAPDEIQGLAEILQQVTIRYDNLFEISFPYSMGFHQAPNPPESHPEAHLHAHFYPPLLRSATVRKFMVGFEMLAMPQRDLTPEMAAVRLSEAGQVHFRKREEP